MRQASRVILAAAPTITTTIQSAGNQVADTISGFETLDAKGELRERVQGCGEL